MSEPRGPRRFRAYIVVALLGTLMAAAWFFRAADADEPAASTSAPPSSAPSSTLEPAAAAFHRATVWIEVVSDAGDPVAGASITLRTAAGAREQRSDEAGLTTFASLLPGPYTVEVKAAGYEPLEAREVLRPGLSEAAWTLRLHIDPQSAGALRGVVMSEGAPVAGALITALVDGQARQEGATKSGPDGRFVLPWTSDAAAVVAFHEKHGVGERALAEEREVLVELPAPGYVEGRVSDDKGQPLPSFRVQVRVSDLPPGLVRALVAANGGGREGSRAARRKLTQAWVTFPKSDDDELGAFRVGPVPAGGVRVVASAEGRAPAEREVTVSPGDVTRGVVLSLPGPLVVTGCVTDAKSGEPVRGARVHAVRKDAPDAPDFGFATVDDDGCYRLLTTAGVRHSVAVRARGYVTSSVGGVVGRADTEVQRDFALERSSGKRGEGFRYVGIGARLTPHDEGAQVLEVFTSGSAAGALSPGDVILRVDGEWTRNTALERIVELIMGEDGTEVELLVQPKDGGPVRTVVLSRRATSSSG